MKSFLASVGTAKGFNNKGDIILNATALTDSGFNISTSKEEIRGGQGASLKGQFFHTTQFTVNLKDAIFDLNYLALQVGGKITQGGNEFKTEQVIVKSNKITVEGTPKDFGGYGIVGWYTHIGKDDYTTIKFDGKNATVSGAKEGDALCVTYVQTNDSARAFEVATAYIPSEIHLVFDMPMFNAGVIDKDAMSTESQIGVLTVDIPRFQFNGSVDLTTAMSGASTVDISGSALQSGVQTCSGKGVYAIITENFFDRGEFDNVYAIVVEDSDIDLKPEETQVLKVIAFHNDGTMPHIVDNSKLTFTSKGGSFASVGANTGLVTALGTGESVIEIKVTNKPSLEAKAVVTVTE